MFQGLYFLFSILSCNEPFDRKLSRNNARAQNIVFTNCVMDLVYTFSKADYSLFMRVENTENKTRVVRRICLQRKQLNSCKKSKKNCVQNGVDCKLQHYELNSLYMNIAY